MIKRLRNQLVKHDWLWRNGTSLCYIVVRLGFELAMTTKISFILFKHFLKNVINCIAQINFFLILKLFLSLIKQFMIF